MKPIWKHIHPWIESAVINLVSIDTLLRQVAGILAITYRADCLLWAELESQDASRPVVYATPRVIRDLEKDKNFILETASPPSSHPLPPPSWHRAVRKFYPRELPSWIQDQRQHPEILQLGQGELIMPVVKGNVALSHQSLQFIIQLNRPPLQSLPLDRDEVVNRIVKGKTGTQMSDVIGSRANGMVPEKVDAKGGVAVSDSRLSLQDRQQAAEGFNQVWSLADIDALEVVCSQLSLAYSTVYWRQRLEQSRQQAELVGRITQLLNSCLNPDELVSRIVAELGQGLDSDRSFLVDLRKGPAKILSVWDHPDRPSQSLLQRKTDRSNWQNIIDRFIHGGAAFLEFNTQQSAHAACQSTKTFSDQLLDEAKRDSFQPWLNDIGATTALVVPLFIQDKFFGAVVLLSYQGQRAYGLDELQTIQQVTDQAAIALNNAQHYQSLRCQKEALHIQNKSLRLEVLQDDLTQLLNRRSLESKLADLSTPALWTLQPPFAITVFDIDHFKTINDTHGHLVGDQVLQGLALRIQALLRQGNLAYRYGGEEFVIVLPETKLAEALRVAECLRQAISVQPFDTPVGPVHITASFGLTQQNATQDKDAWTVLQRADQALYQAKHQGRNCVVDLSLESSS